MKNTDSLHIDAKINLILDSLHNEGFINPDIEIKNDSISKVKIKTGIKYKWLNLDFEIDKQYLLDELRFDIKKWEGKFVSPKQVSILSNKILDLMDDSGYPFAFVKLDSIRFIGKDSISAKFRVKNNKKFYFDTIKITSKVDLSSKFLENFLEIKKGDVFRRSKVNSIKKKIDNLRFVDLDKSPTVGFFGNEATINLNLKAKKVNRFDFLLGILPDSKNTGKYKITGELTADVLNKLGRGERLYFKYRNLSQGKQNLRLDVNYPYILDMPYGIDSKFQLYVNEDKYRDVNFDLGVQYLFKGINYVKTYWSLFSSRLINIDSTNLFILGKLPDKLDVSTNSLGLLLNLNTLDYKFNPLKGLELVLDGNIGQRKILENQQIIELKNEIISFEESYDSLKLMTYVFNLSSNFAYYYPIKNNFVFKFGNKTAWKKSQKSLYQNELFRIGGNKILRGFDEESIFAEFYSITTIEMRLLMDKNSFLFAFFDYGIVSDPFSLISQWDRPYGFGVGINFDTKGGILSLNTAVGSQYNNPLDFKNVKIHIGYVNLF